MLLSIADILKYRHFWRYYVKSVEFIGVMKTYDMTTPPVVLLSNQDDDVRHKVLTLSIILGML